MDTSSGEGGQGLNNPSVLHPPLEVIEVLAQGAAEKHGAHHPGELAAAFVAPPDTFQFCLFEAVPEMGGAKLHPNRVHMGQKSGRRLEVMLHGKAITLLRSPSAMSCVHPAASTLTVQKGSPSYA